MSNKIELLAPGGDIDSIKAAIAAGADAVYCGLNKFNARNRAENISINNLSSIVRLAHNNDCKVYLTLNILITQNEIPDLINILNQVVNTKIDGVIVQDLGLFYLLNRYFPSLEIHASTQCTTHNKGQIHFLNQLNVKQLNLSRELSIKEIKNLNSVCNSYGITSEVFVHGSNCISFSGQCYMSSVLSGNSGNKGRCSQNCREQFIKTPVGRDFPLNIKDKSAFKNIAEIIRSGSKSLKIEGRIKKFDYVYSVVKTYREQIDNLENNKELNNDDSDLYRVFNRDFTNAFLTGIIDNSIFIDHPLSNSVKHFKDLNSNKSEQEIDKAIDNLLKSKDSLTNEATAIINKLSIEKVPLKIIVTGAQNEVLKISITSPIKTIEISSNEKLNNSFNYTSTRKELDKLFKLTENTDYTISDISFEKFDSELKLSSKEIKKLKNKFRYFVSGEKDFIKPVSLPKLTTSTIQTSKPKLDVLISSKEDISLADNNNTQVYFEIPNSIGDKLEEYVKLFKDNAGLTPWFPTILIDQDYTNAVKLLEEINPKRIVTNNTGIAYEAFKNNVTWIAGPHLNIINSYSLLCLKENFNCSGAYISNEINEMQIKSINVPENFELYFSIYHPIELMTNRLCLFHQVNGCEKKVFDNDCIKNCKKTASIKTLSGKTFFIDKSKDLFNKVYHDKNYLNIKAINDLASRHVNFMIDLRDIQTETNLQISKKSILDSFKEQLLNNNESETTLSENILNTTFSQYKKGI